MTVTCLFPFDLISWAGKLDRLTRMSTSDPEGYLAHPVNAYKLVKRLNTEWSDLESLVLHNPSDGMVLSCPSVWGRVGWGSHHFGENSDRPGHKCSPLFDLLPSEQPW